jgi:hypothetical protein
LNAKNAIVQIAENCTGQYRLAYGDSTNKWKWRWNLAVKLLKEAVNDSAEISNEQRFILEMQMTDGDFFSYDKLGNIIQLASWLNSCSVRM